MRTEEIYKLASQLLKSAQGVSLGLGESGGGYSSKEEMANKAKELLLTVKPLVKTFDYQEGIRDPWASIVLNKIAEGERVPEGDKDLALFDAKKYFDQNQLKEFSNLLRCYR